MSILFINFLWPGNLMVTDVRRTIGFFFEKEKLLEKRKNKTMIHWLLLFKLIASNAIYHRLYQLKVNNNNIERVLRLTFWVLYYILI